jgi:hypothetical protein
MSYIPDFAAADIAMRAKLASSEFQEVRRRLAAGGVTDGKIQQLVDATATSGLPKDDWARIEALCRGGDPMVVSRYVLLVAMLHNLERVRRYPVVEEVKGRLLDFFLYVCEPDRETDQLLDPRRHGFGVMCRMATLRRFPAGQFDWEIGGVPRSWLLQVPKKDFSRLAWTVWGKAGGREPFFMVHTSYRRELPILTVEDERHGTRLATASMELQPGIRGLIGASWMLDPKLASVSPHMSWLAALQQENRRFGAFFSHTGPASPDAGFLVGDRRRRRAYESGDWKPVNGISVWARRDMLRWLRQTA